MIGMPIVVASVRSAHRARAMSVVLTLVPLSRGRRARGFSGHGYQPS
ncbi:hypothetical protein [Amycolatopsis anabasis]|nr:hypothetical protein [Amycolatopsis anabasis]